MSDSRAPQAMADPSSAGSARGIIDAVMAVDGVEWATVVEHEADGAIEVTVCGGRDSDVVLAIGQAKAASIQTIGARKFGLASTAGIGCVIHFSRVEDGRLRAYGVHDRTPHGGPALQEAMVLRIVGNDVELDRMLYGISLDSKIFLHQLDTTPDAAIRRWLQKKEEALRVAAEAVAAAKALLAEQRGAES